MKITEENRHPTVDDLIAKLQQLSDEGHGSRTVQFNERGSRMTPYASSVAVIGSSTVVITN